MLAWRLTSPAFADRLDGEGNRRHGARWNSPGRGVLYASEHLSLCVLESLAHLPAKQRQALPPMMAIGIGTPDIEGTIVSRAEIERHDRDLARWCRHRGDEWLSLRRHLILIAPSLVVPQEHNIMLNPAHPDMANVKIVFRERFEFDPRLNHARRP